MWVLVWHTLMSSMQFSRFPWVSTSAMAWQAFPAEDREMKLVQLFLAICSVIPLGVGKVAPCIKTTLYTFEIMQKNQNKIHNPWSIRHHQCFCMNHYIPVYEWQWINSNVWIRYCHKLWSTDWGSLSILSLVRNLSLQPKTWNKLSKITRAYDEDVGDVEFKRDSCDSGFTDHCLRLLNQLPGNVHHYKK